MTNPLLYTTDEERRGWWLPVGLSGAIQVTLILLGYFLVPKSLSFPITIDTSADSAAPSGMVQEVDLIPEETPTAVAAQPESTPAPPAEAPAEPEIAENTPPEPAPPSAEPSDFVKPEAAPPPAHAVAQAAPAVAPAPDVASSPAPNKPPTVAPSISHSSEAIPGDSVAIGSKEFPKPPYPYDARVKRIQGTVLVSIDVVDGAVAKVAVMESCGYSTLDVAATSWIKNRWRFPQQITQSFHQPVKFELAQ